MSSLKQMLTLSTVGTSLLTSNSFWFFDFFGIQPIQNDLAMEQVSNPPQVIQTPPKRTTANMNGFRSASKHTNINGKPQKNTKLKTGTFYSDMGVDITLDDLPGSKYMNKISNKLEDFTLSLFTATEKDYHDFPKSEIKISLFSQAAWYSSTNKDEYSTELKSEQINELFKNQEEAKVKQLLLSLHKRLEWEKYYYKEKEKQTLFNSSLAYPKTLQDLKDLKIKYFKDFDGLKQYVHTKVSTCTEETSCIADLGELDVMDTDQLSFFEDLEKASKKN